MPRGINRSKFDSKKSFLNRIRKLYEIKCGFELVDLRFKQLNS